MLYIIPGYHRLFIWKQMNFENCTPGFPVPVLFIYVSFLLHWQAGSKEIYKSFVGNPMALGWKEWKVTRDTPCMDFPSLKSNSQSTWKLDGWNMVLFAIWGKRPNFRGYGSFREGIYLNVVHFHGKF